MIIQTVLLTPGQCPETLLIPHISECNHIHHPNTQGVSTGTERGDISKVETDLPGPQCTGLLAVPQADNPSLGVLLIQTDPVLCVCWM